MDQPKAGFRMGAVTAALVAGVGSILVNEATITTVGVVLTIVGLMGLMPLVRYSMRMNGA